METSILDCLRQYPGSTVKEIVAKLGGHKKTLNPVLYDMKQKGKLAMSGVPPRWFLVIESTPGSSERFPLLTFPEAKISPKDPDSGGRVRTFPVDLVAIDLGNVHDCLENLALMTIPDSSTVMAFAGSEYNGFGINPPIKLPNITIYKSNQSIEICMTWTISRWLASKSDMRSCGVILASRNKTISSLARIIGLEGHNVTIVGSWKEMAGSF